MWGWSWSGVEPTGGAGDGIGLEREERFIEEGAVVRIPGTRAESTGQDCCRLERRVIASPNRNLAIPQSQSTDSALKVPSTIHYPAPGPCCVSSWQVRFGPHGQGDCAGKTGKKVV
ncbi:hypothetical protein CVT26_010736 [Gymnopilus dilepis]|uniref:Uncharacterized protein n=1 Tax=Gymnopilus dilepis TaxID=231916 RepID=A0A409Y0Y6_9AGAR|nr:hypothetical protein CVT26_010736 [Gymnopilus dilepis]